MKNIIYIISDQMRWDALPCNGADFVKAPNFVRLAKNSTNFSCTYSGNPVCVPSRGILATGCYSHRCMSADGLNKNGGSISPEHIHIAQYLGDNGYTTYGLGKFHCLPYITNPGFDVFELAEEGRTGLLGNDNIKEDYLEYLRDKGLYGMQRAHGIGNNDIRAGHSPLPIEDYIDTWSTTRSLELLENHIKKDFGKPFYLQLGFVKPHAPYDPPVPFDSMYDPLKIPKPWGGAEDLPSRNPLMATWRPNYLIDHMSDAAIQYSRSHYFGLISYLDLQLGRIMDFLKVNNIMKDTIIVFTADHGDNLGDHGLFFKTFFTEGSVRIPLLIHDPASTCKGLSFRSPVGQEDIMPTICELANIEIPSGIDGISLKKQVSDISITHKPFVISQFDSGENMTLMLRDKRYKYCFCRLESTEELYDMQSDPREINNLVVKARFAEVLVKLRNEANNWCLINSHEPILNNDGSLTYSRFDLSEHLHEPSKLLGIRPW